MQPLIAVTVLACLASTPIDDFNPHQLGAAQAFIAKHHDTCGPEEPVIIERGITSEECQSQAMLHVMPDWLRTHPNDLYLGAICTPHQYAVPSIQEQAAER
jgi:hypothetical protein